MHNIAGVMKSLAIDGGKVVIHCIVVLCKRRFGLFTSTATLTNDLDQNLRLANTGSTETQNIWIRCL